MYYGVEQSTDMREKRTVIKKFRTLSALAKWLGSHRNGRLTYEDPEGARNYHHTFRSGYELEGRVDKKHPIFRDRGTPTYPRNDADNLANYMFTYGKEIAQ